MRTPPCNGRTVIASIDTAEAQGSSGVPRPRLRRTPAMSLLVLLLAVVAAGLIAPTAHATSLTITSPASGAVVHDGAVTAKGAGTVGDQIQVGLGGHADPLCMATVIADGSWSCPLHLPDGRNTLTAVELLAAGGTSSTSVEIAVLSAPIIQSADGMAKSAGSVRGTAYPGASVAATATNGASCLATVDSTGAWFCQLAPTPPPGSYQVTATQNASFAGKTASPVSNTVTLVVDTVAPTTPTLTSPTSGASLPMIDASYSGSGVDGSRTYVYVDRVMTCEATVNAGEWSCTGGSITAGPHRVSAIAGSAAGNYSPPSPWIDVVFAAPSSPTPPPDPDTTNPDPSHTPQAATPTPEKAAPAPNAPATPTHPDRSAPTPPDHSDDGATATPMPHVGPDSAAPEPPATSTTTGGWNDATRMTTALAADTSIGTITGWLRALALALLTVALIMAPARLAMAGRAPRTWRLTGRNRAAVEYEDRPRAVPVPPLVTMIGMIGSAAVLALFSGHVDGQPAYLRLLIALIVAVGVVNTTAVGIPVILGKRLGMDGIRASATPSALVLVVGAALLSRFAGLDPAFLFGVVIGLVLPTNTSTRNRARLETLRVLSLLTLAGVTWGVSTLMVTDGSLAAMFVAEVLNATTLLAVGSSVVLLLPLGRRAGHNILRWSLAIWLGLTLLATTMLFLLLSPTITAWWSEGSGAPLAFATISFSAICISAWAWRRYVE
ncbi:hypothetical protein [Rathayibacter toxicus]|nr:hypothetical protein [Rathayibacter toxicus]